MAITVANIVNKLSCGAGSYNLGTGTAFCDFNIKTPYLIALSKKNVSIPSNTTWSKTVMTDLIQQEKLIVISGVVNFTDTTAKNSYQTFDNTGLSRLTLKNPMSADLEFIHGYNHFKAINSLESNSLFDIWIVDIEGKLICAKNEDGSIRGLDMAMFSIENYVMGTQPSYMAKYQIQRGDFDNNLVVITPDVLGFDAKRVLAGHNDVSIKFINPSAGLNFVFSVWATNNNKQVPIAGLDATEFKLEKAVVTSGVTVGWNPVTFGMTTSTGTETSYTATLPSVTPLATGEIYRMKTYDSNKSTNIIYPDGVFYKSLNPANENYFEFTVI